MDDLTARALDTATARGAQYADVRLVRQERQLVLVRNGTVEQVSLGEDAGFGVRALVDGAWGFAVFVPHRPGRGGRGGRGGGAHRPRQRARPPAPGAAGRAGAQPGDVPHAAST